MTWMIKMGSPILGKLHFADLRRQELETPFVEPQKWMVEAVSVSQGWGFSHQVKLRTFTNYKVNIQFLQAIP